MSTGLTLYQRLVRVTHVYLGPAADRFIIRQVENHLHKNPEDLTIEDLDKLIDWIRVAVSLITEDEAIVQAYTEQLHRLASKPRPSYTNKHKEDN